MTNRQKGQIIELDIERLAFGGAGIGKHDGMTVFVEKTVPGDRVRASFFKIKNNYAEANLTEIVTPSTDRIKPRCSYSGACGGCQMMFMPYEKQLAFKQQHVIDALERIGKIPNPPVEKIIGSKDRFFYRNKMEFTFGYDSKMNFTLGLHQPGFRFDILDINECHLQSELSVKIVNSARELVKKLKWPPFKYSNGEGFLRSLIIRDCKRTGEVMVILNTSDQIPKNLAEGLKKFVELMAGFKEVVSIFHLSIISRRGMPNKIKETMLYGRPAITEKMILENGDELDFTISPQAFFQVNTFQAEILYNNVLKMASSRPQELVLDFFCGIGTIGLFMAKHAEKVLGIELNEEAVKAAKKNAQRNDISNIEFNTGDVVENLPAIRQKPSLIVVDPPRAGLTGNLIDIIGGLGANQLVYVSCDPATLARDCDQLKRHGFMLKKVQPVDMFPHTFHIENVCLLEKHCLLEK
ncbi:23S rRNA (uracil(1939)-C(5))-methyltransferase RlmD [Candidatus Peregrinibacteria bacterium]|nr:23S rRNA (uracil(1939)-C(5))-methyltransferase RlmD [Candidatus Peregrinibacteria bacterium]